jgi:hypothetical protein
MSHNDPLKTINSSPARAPDWQLSRVVSQQDANFAARGYGVNAGGFNAIRVAVTPMTFDPTLDPTAVPGGTANPSVEVRLWSEQAQAFIPMPAPVTRSGAGVGTPYVFDVPNANGSILGVFVTNNIGGHFVAISVQGYENGGNVPNAAILTLDTSSPIPVTVPTPVPVTQSAGVLSMFADMANSLLGLATTISGGSLKVAVQTLPALVLAAGSNAIGKLAANAGVNIGSVDVLTLPSVVLAAGTNAFGKLVANVGVNIGSVDVLTLPSLVLAAGANAIGKLAANAGVNIGTVDIAALGSWVDTVASADTAAHAYGTSQVLKAPAFIRAARTMTGTVTISDGVRPGMVLSQGDPMPFFGTNLNQLNYQFSIFNATTEKFSISVGI